MNTTKFIDEIIPKAVDFLKLQSWKKIKLQVDFPFTDEMQLKYDEFLSDNLFPNCFLEILVNGKVACSVLVEKTPELFYYDFISPKIIHEEKINDIVEFMAIYTSINIEIYEKRLIFFENFYTLLKS